MRIAFDGKRYFNNRTGLGNFSRELVHALAARFPDDEFVLFHSKPQKFETAYKNLSLFAPKSAGIGWRSFGIAADAAKLGIDVYHGLSNEIPFGLRKHGIKSVVTIHDVIFKRYPGYYPFVDRQVYGFKTKYALKNADAVVAASNATLSDLVDYFQFPEKKGSVIYQPIIPAFYEHRFHVNKEASTPYFLYVSGFSDRKNHGVLVEAFKLIAKQCEWDLVLAGANGNTLNRIKRFVDHENLGHRIRIMTDLPQEQLLTVLGEASGFVYPSLFEGFGIPLAEAAAMGIPMAVSDIPVFKELAESAALYFHPNDAREVADAMLKLTNPEFTVPLVRQAHTLLAKIDPKKIAEAYMAVYAL